jgi:hypothetical protein
MCYRGLDGHRLGFIFVFRIIFHNKNNIIELSIKNGITVFNVITCEVHASCWSCIHTVELSRKQWLLSAISLVRRLTWRFCRATNALFCGRRRKYGRSGHKPNAPAVRPFPLGTFLERISVTGWVDPMAIVRLEGLGQLGNTRASRIEPATLQLVTQWSNQLRYRLPPTLIVLIYILIRKWKELHWDIY